MIFKCSPCSRDAGQVVPDLAVDLSKVLESGVVPNTGTEVRQNGIENLSDISGRVKDNFNALDLEAEYNRVARSSRSSKSSQSASNEASSAGAETSTSCE